MLSSKGINFLNVFYFFTIKSRDRNAIIIVLSWETPIQKQNSEKEEKQQFCVLLRHTTAKQNEKEKKIV